jgi:TonB family protein
MSQKVISVRSLSWSCLLLLILSSWVFLSPQSSSAQQEPVIKRRLVDRVAPVYPALARSMALEGIVKVDALVAADGSVKGVDVKGGHPVLAQAAMNAVRHWKWEGAAHESHEVVEVKFSPSE